MHRVQDIENKMNKINEKINNIETNMEVKIFYLSKNIEINHNYLFNLGILIQLKNNGYFKR